MSAAAMQWAHKTLPKLNGDVVAGSILQWLAWNHIEGHVLTYSAAFVARALGLKDRKTVSSACQRLAALGVIRRIGKRGGVKAMTLNIHLDFLVDDKGQIYGATGTIEPVRQTDNPGKTPVRQTDRGCPSNGQGVAVKRPGPVRQTDTTKEEEKKKREKRSVLPGETYAAKNRAQLEKRAAFCSLWGVRQVTDDQIADAVLKGACHWDADLGTWQKGGGPDHA